MRTAAGLVAIDARIVLPFDVTVTIDTYVPILFYEEGGDFVEIDGTGFPEGLDTDDDVSVTFEDGTICTIVSMTATSIRCKTAEFESVVFRRNL